MSNPDTYHAFPLPRVVAALTGVGVAAALVAWGVMGAMAQPQATRVAVLMSVAISYLAAVIGVLPVFVYGPRGVQATQAAYFIGMGGRVVACLLAGLAAVYVLHFPFQATLLGIAGAYVPLLLVEVAFVGRYLTQKDSLSPAPNPANKEALA